MVPCFHKVMHGCPPPDLRCSRAQLRAGFTLVEMLVVMVVIALLAYLAFGAARSAIRSSQTTGSLSNMRQLTGALLAFAADNNNKLPDYRYPNVNFAYSWDLQIFPYLGIQNGYSGVELSPQLKQGLDLKVFRCPLDSRQMSPERAFYPRSYGMTASGVEAVPLQSGEELFTDRPGRLVNQVPMELEGARFLRLPIEGTHTLDVARAGMIYFLTPQPHRNRDSQSEALLEQGFEPVDIPEFRLFGTDGMAQLVTLYQKKAEAGETITIGKWAVPVIFP